MPQGRCGNGDSETATYPGQNYALFTCRPSAQFEPRYRHQYILFLDSPRDRLGYAHIDETVSLNLLLPPIPAQHVDLVETLVAQLRSNVGAVLYAAHDTEIILNRRFVEAISQSFTASGVSVVAQMQDSDHLNCLKRVRILISDTDSIPVAVVEVRNRRLLMAEDPYQIYEYCQEAIENHGLKKIYGIFMDRINLYICEVSICAKTLTLHTRSCGLSIFPNLFQALSRVFLSTPEIKTDADYKIAPLELDDGNELSMRLTGSIGRGSSAYVYRVKKIDSEDPDFALKMFFYSEDYFLERRHVELLRDSPYVVQPIFKSNTKLCLAYPLMKEYRCS